MRSYKHLMSAVSKAFPILLVGSFAFAVLRAPWFLQTIPSGLNESLTSVAMLAINSFVLLLCANLAKSIGGEIAASGGYLMGGAVMVSQTGVLGAIVGGVLIGVVSQVFNKKTIQSQLMAMVLIPLSALLLTAVYWLLLKDILVIINQFLVNHLRDLPIWLRVVYGAGFGCFMIMDLGGPINKLNSLFLNAVYLLGFPLASTIKMTGGMIAPVGIGFALLLKRRSEGLKMMGLGSLFVTEALLAVEQENPQAVRRASVLGTALTCGVMAYYNLELLAVHGGLLMSLTMDQWGLYMVVFGSGVLLTGLSYLWLAGRDPQIKIEEDTLLDINEFMEEK